MKPENDIPFLASLGKSRLSHKGTTIISVNKRVYHSCSPDTYFRILVHIHCIFVTIECNNVNCYYKIAHFPPFHEYMSSL